MFKRLLSSALIFGMAAIAPPAFAASCAPRDGVVERLQQTYSENLTAGGLQQSQSVNTVVEVWSSAETGSFTVLVTHPTGISCIVAAGEHYFEVATPANLPGLPS
ncbi:hypothetical protein [Phaeobacter sp. 11ANDIMAR09]|uniref:hypothetical protein n=1 Tax=Phaeobacter sp. 11ANDIMAR09 TaxID=1225647 RepID=UPI0006C8772C|nr:hypothetical protein [Phaeobacter sp. 11ANDIMAR09]KPD14346.1 hypothetical protein AN476_01005 [Phaeobacter sp. 11ANDIMAR09]OIQ34314.1 MAG: hypothetical protein BM559_07020 [Roseobacter sp. MedPE-SWchi]